MTVLKRITEGVVNALNWAEKAIDPDSVVLPGFRRSLQFDGYSCGVQSTFMILRYYRKARSVLNVERELGTDADGTTTRQIRSLIRRRGLHSTIIPKARLRDLRSQIDLGRPVLISPLDSTHWSVVYGYSPNIGIYVADPFLPVGLSCLFSGEEFKDYWDRWAMPVYEGKFAD